MNHTPIVRLKKLRFDNRKCGFIVYADRRNQPERQAQRRRLTRHMNQRRRHRLVDDKTLSHHVTAHAPDGFSKRKPRLEISNHGCSSIRCPRWDSNPHCTDFEAVSSTNWDTGAFAQLDYINTEKCFCKVLERSAFRTMCNTLIATYRNL